MFIIGRNCKVYSYVANLRAHRLIRPDACGEIGLFESNNDMIALLSVMREKDGQTDRHETEWPQIRMPDPLFPLGNISAPHPSVSVLDANPMGFSDPSSVLWESTAPMPYAEASHASIISCWGLKWTSIYDDNNFFEALNAFLSSSPHFQGTFCLNCRYNGARVFGRFRRKRE